MRALLAAVILATCTSQVDAGRLVTVPTAAGIRVTVSVGFAPRLQAFVAALVARGYRPRHIGCYARGGHVRHSLHYRGEACDFDQTGHGRTAPTMRHVGAIAASLGLRDGCTFRDCGHIDSGRPVTRLQIARRRFLKRSRFATR